MTDEEKAREICGNYDAINEDMSDVERGIIEALRNEREAAIADINGVTKAEYDAIRCRIIARIRSRAGAPAKLTPEVIRLQDTFLRFEGQCPDCGEAVAVVRHERCGDTRSAPAKSPCPGCRCCEYDPAYHGTGQELPIPEDPFLSEQIDRLASFILEHVPGEPSENAGAVDTAIRVLGEWGPIVTAARRVMAEWKHGRPALKSESLDALVAAVEAKS